MITRDEFPRIFKIPTPSTISASLFSRLYRGKSMATTHRTRRSHFRIIPWIEPGGKKNTCFFLATYWKVYRSCKAALNANYPPFQPLGGCDPELPWFNVVKFKGIHKYGWKYEYYGGKDPQQPGLENSTSGAANHGVDGRGDVKSSPQSSQWLSFTSFFVVSLRSQVETQQIQGKFPQKLTFQTKLKLKKCVSKLHAPVLQQIFLVIEN